MNEIDKLRAKPTISVDIDQLVGISPKVVSALQQQAGYSFGNDLHTAYTNPVRTCDRCPRRMTCNENRLNREVAATPSLGNLRSVLSIQIN